jgi:hypothetical protein
MIAICGIENELAVFADGERRSAARGKRIDTTLRR